MERNRITTEEKLIDAAGEIIAEEGFEALGVRKIAEKARVNKTLIYRYFGSLNGLVHAYMKKHDFGLHTTLDQSNISDIKSYLKAFYRSQISEYRNNITLKRLRRWELSSDKEFLTEVRTQREQNGVRFMEMMTRYTSAEKWQLQAVAALLDAGIAYLAMIEETCPKYNGIDVRSDEGWAQITAGIDALIDIIIT